MYDYHDILFAMCGIRILGLILIVSVVSYISQSRTMFLVGALGCFLGLMVSETGRTVNGTPEGMFMSMLNRTASHMLFYGIIGGAFGCGIVRFITKRTIIETQFS